MENSKFKLSGGYGYTIFMALLCVINVGLAPLLIVLSIIRKEGVASLIGMCVLALVVLGIFGLPTVLRFILSLSYVKVDGTNFAIKIGFHKKYTVACADLKKLRCYKDISGKGNVTYYIRLEFGDDKTLDIPHGWRNFKQLAAYLAGMHDAGVIAENVIRNKDKKTLLRYSKGEFAPKRKKRARIKKGKAASVEHSQTKYVTGEREEGSVYTTCIRVAEMDSKSAIKVLLPVAIWAITVFTCLVLNGVLAPRYYAITAPALIFSFLIIIPAMIIMVKGARKLNKKIVYSDKNVSFDVTPDQVYMNGKKVTIKLNEVSGCFDIYTGKLKGYTVEWGSTKEFRKFLDENEIPYEEYGDGEE